MSEQKFYKVLLNGKSATRLDYEWNLPTKNDDGTWTPGEWHSLSGEVSIPRNALHVTKDPKQWWKHGADCYEVETRGEETEYQEYNHKKGVLECRLMRKLTREELANDFNLVIVQEGETAKLIEGQHCYAYGNATVEAYGNATVRADGNATVRADGNATVEAYGNATVRADGNATVRAYGNATVEAYGNATVEAYGNATVEAYGNATVRADGNATVEAYGNATVEAYGNATVRADGNATVRADGNATVEAYGNATVRADGNATVRAYGNATVNQYRPAWTWEGENNSKVTISGDAIGIDRRSGSPVVTTGGAS